MARIGHYTEISYGVESGATGSRNDGVQCMCYASTDDEASNGNCCHCATKLSIRNEKYLKNLCMVEIITLLRKQVWCAKSQYKKFVFEVYFDECHIQNRLFGIKSK